jgi:hypothetical protein
MDEANLNLSLTVQEACALDELLTAIMLDKYLLNVK